MPESALRIRFYHQDHLGSSSLIADASGHVVEEVSNYSFGHTRYSVRPRAIREPFGFTQKERDVESGLHYFEARYQAATLARFTRLDPLARDVPSEWLHGPQMLNLYAYGGNNPVRYRDPSGQFLETAWDVASLAMGIASIKSWDGNTSFLEKALDVGGVVVDTVAIIVPFVPGGAGAAMKAGKLATKADDFIDARKAFSTAHKSDDIRGASQKAQFVYDSRAGRYRNTDTGRFASEKNLPWPKNDGFASKTRGTVPEGAVVDRYGRPSGRYGGEPGATASQRGLPPGSEGREYHKYRANEPIPADIGPAGGVPEFGAKGGGQQYRLDKSFDQLVKEGKLTEIP